MSARNDHGRKTAPRKRKEIVRARLTTIGIRDRRLKKVRSAGDIGSKQGTRFASDGATGKILRGRASLAAAKALQRRPTAFKLLPIKTRIRILGRLPGENTIWLASQRLGERLTTASVFSTKSGSLRRRALTAGSCPRRPLPFISASAWPMALACSGCHSDGRWASPQAKTSRSPAPATRPPSSARSPSPATPCSPPTATGPSSIWAGCSHYSLCCSAPRPRCGAAGSSASVRARPASSRRFAGAADS